jgi:hypothetical protein
VQRGELRKKARRPRSDEKHVRQWIFVGWLIGTDGVTPVPWAKEEFPAYFHKPVWV